MNKFKLILLLFSLIQIPLNVFGQNNPKVLVFEIRAEIDPRMNRHVQLALEEADNQEADYVIIDMDTYGGAVNDADDIRSMILDYEKPVFVFINKNAASAGALISIACDSIYMEEGSTIGAATVVNGVDGAKAPDKYQSYFRKKMRSTAEAKGRNPDISEAMVDENIEVEGISKEGQVITFTTTEAIKYGYCEKMVESIDEILKINNIENAEIIKYEPNGTEAIISLFLNPAISSILILIIIGGLYFELQTPGVGFPIIASIMAAVLYFTPYYLNGLAANWEIIAFGVGVLLIAAEIFVIPGFGVAGISGIIITISSLALVMVDNDWFDFQYVPTGDLKSALLATFGGTVGAIVLMFVGASQIKNSPFLKHIALNETLQKDDGYTSSFNTDQILIGLTGKAYTVLRPSGKIMIDGKIYDASTRGDYIEKGEEIVVISDEGTSLKVKKHEADKLVE